MAARFLGMVASAVAATAIAAAAQQVTLGEAEFLNSCAQCHGADGKGDGVITRYLTTPPPDLTRIQIQNGGVFPVSTLYETIEGSSIGSVHGTGEMPAWGWRYNIDAQSMLGQEYTAADQKAFVRTRILALIEHIASLQQTE